MSFPSFRPQSKGREHQTAKMSNPPDGAEHCTRREISTFKSHILPPNREYINTIPTKFQQNSNKKGPFSQPAAWNL